jgi:hypothetical protein
MTDKIALYRPVRPKPLELIRKHRSRLERQIEDRLFERAFGANGTGQKRPARSSSTATA